MLYTAMTKQALRLCYQAHSGQTDHGGLPYVFHPLHLAEQMQTEDEICVALLHDIMEDTSCTTMDLLRLGFSQPVLNALQTLTRASDVPYMEYVSALRTNSLARRVKQADLKHNMDLRRLNAVTRLDQRRQQKYRIALSILADDSWDEKRQAFCKYIPLDEGPYCALFVFYQKKSPDKPARVIGIRIVFRTTPPSEAEISLAEMQKLTPRLRRALARAEQPQEVPAYDAMSFPELLAEYLAVHPDQPPQRCLQWLRRP